MSNHKADGQDTLSFFLECPELENLADNLYKLEANHSIDGVIFNRVSAHLKAVNWKS